MTSDIGADLGFRRTGLVYATDDAKQLEEWENWRVTARQFDVNTRMLTSTEATAAIPANGREWLGGVNSVDDGKAEPALAAPTIAEGARFHGATIHQGCAARNLDLTNGAVTGVETEKGLIRTSAVLCAAGAWASAFCRRQNIVFPQASVRQTAVRTGAAPNIGEALYTPDCALTRRLDGSYTLAISGAATLELTPQAMRFWRPFLPMFLKRLKAVQMTVGKSFLEGPEGLQSWLLRDNSAFERTRVLNPPPSSRYVSEVVGRVKKRFPQLQSIEVAEAWGAYVDFTPDAVPVISPVEQISGFFIAAGCSGHGFGLGPGIGCLAADLVANDSPCVDPTPFGLSRLLDGSKVQVGAI
jgi:glycine/D-amino acid oxidase-like deaminating enzyme